MSSWLRSLSAIFPSLIFILELLIVRTLSLHHHDYCVIGSGPSGLQMGYFLQKAQRDYVIFEKANISGSFYTTYPRHRTMISINKRYTGKTNKEFNLRHDWNSLISDDPSLLFGQFSKDMFPHADTFVHYLNEYKKRLNLNVQYNTEISHIESIGNETKPLFSMADQNDNEYQCRTLIVATGMWKPNIPDVVGIELTEGYESVSVDPDEFENQTILILGKGNAAFETASNIYGVTNVIHLVGRSRMRLAWATHYVGDLRAVNNAILDTYQLKSLDGILEANIEEIQLVKHNNKIYLEFSDGNDPEAMLDNFSLREPYDRIIRCLGFHFDISIFNKKMRPGKGRRSKYPVIKQNYESVDMPGVFFAGTATHSLDHRKSAGGFIHGFRYTARTLHHYLEWRNHEVQWPTTRLPITELMNSILKRINEASGIYQMFSVLGDVVTISNDGSEFEYIEEFPINLLHQFTNITGRPAARVIAIVLEYGPEFSGPGKDIFRIDRATGEPAEAHKSNFLHPVFYYYKSLPTESDMKKRKTIEILPRPTLLHHIVEDFLTTWDAPISHILPLRRFVENCIGKQFIQYFAESCFQMAMSHTTLPLTCQYHYLNNEGLTGTKDLHLIARESGYSLS